MSGFNISEYLSTQAGNNANNASGVSSLYGSLGSNKTGVYQKDALGIDLSQYSLIKNGSYGKLMRKYYREDNMAVNGTTDTYVKKQNITAEKAADLSTTVNNLMDKKYNESERDSISGELSKFVKDYNKMIDNVSDSDSKSILQKAKWLTNMVSEFSNTLSGVGVNVGNDNKLSINEDAFKKADMSTLQDVFGAGVQSFSSKVLYKAEQIYSLAKTYGSSATSYTSDGFYRRDYTTPVNYDTTT